MRLSITRSLCVLSVVLAFAARAESPAARAAGLDEPMEENIGLGLMRFHPGRGIETVHEDGAEPRYYLVQFHGPVREAWLEHLRQSGAEAIQYVPDNAFLVRATPAQWESVSKNAGVRWTGPHHSAYKLSEDLAWLLGRPIKKVQADRQRYRVAVFRAENLDDVRSSIAGLGGRVEQVEDVEGLYFRTLLVEIDTGRLAELAAFREVARVETWYPVEKLDERSNQIAAGNYIGTVPFIGYESFLANRGMDGSGITIGVVDDGVDTAEVHLSGRVTDNAAIRRGAAAGAEGHGHHNAGIIAGQCTHPADGDGFLYGIGMAPQAHIINIPFLKSGYSGSWMQAQQDILTTAAGNGQTGTVSSNSWGSIIIGNSYQTNEASFDQLVRNNPLAVIVATGNKGPSSASLIPPAAAKNVVAVGAAESYRPAYSVSWYCGAMDADDIEQVVCSSSRGPTLDGRIRPDLVAPGTAIASARAGADPLSGNIDDYHRSMNGTSVAVPHVAGATALLQQKWKSLHAGQLPSPAMTKAILINSAVDPTGNPEGTIPNHTEGWGRLSLLNAMNPDVSMIYNDQQNALAFTGSSYSISGVVDNASLPFRVTLVWSDAPAAAGANPALVNDLDLEIMFGGTLYRGNVFANGVSVTGGSADRRNNVEALYFPAGAANGAFNITIRGKRIVQSQNFALVVFNAATCASPLPPVISASASFPNEIRVTWGAVSGATSYRVLRALSSGGPYTELATTSGLGYWDVNVSRGSAYSYIVRAIGATCESSDSNVISPMAGGDARPPTDLSVTLTSPTSVSLAWTRMPGPAVTGHNVYRATVSTFGNFFVYVGTGENTYVDPTVSAGKTYVYYVTTSTEGAPESAPGNKVIASTFALTDPNLSTHTNIKAAHVTELRAMADSVRAAAGLGPASFTDPALTAGMPIRRVHLTELRSAVDGARSALGLPAVTYTDPAITAESTTVKQAHISELRAAAGALPAAPVTQLLLNPGFESGAVAWTANDSYVIDSINPWEGARTGAWKARLDGIDLYGTPLAETLEQQVAIPSNAYAATLSFWLRVSSTNAASPYGTITVEILNASGTVLQTLATYGDADHTGAWYVKKPFDVLGYKGQTIKVRFSTTPQTDLYRRTEFFIDDTSLDVVY